MGFNVVTSEAARSWRLIELDLRKVAAGATTTVDLFNIPAGASVGLVKFRLVEDLATTDATAVITDLTAQFGDDDDADGFILAKKLLSDNSPVRNGQSDGAYATVTDDDTNDAVVPGVFKLYAAAKKLQVLLTKTGAGNATARFRKGRLLVAFELVQINTP